MSHCISNTTTAATSLPGDRLVTRQLKAEDMPDHLKHIAYVCDFCKQNGALSNALSREAHFGGDASLDSLPHRPGGAPSPEIGNRAGPQNTLSKIGSLTPRLAARTTRWPSSPPRSKASSPTPEMP